MAVSKRVDWFIFEADTALGLRVPYDADLEKIRKIVKKIDKEKGKKDKNTIGDA